MPASQQGRRNAIQLSWRLLFMAGVKGDGASADAAALLVIHFPQYLAGDNVPDADDDGGPTS